MEKNAVILNSADNVAVCVAELKKGEKVILDDTLSFTALTDIPFGHKVSLKPIKKDEDVIKYGYSIGKASADIQKGEWLHVHNIKGGGRL